MDSLAHHDVGQTDACGQHVNAHFNIRWFGALFFSHFQCFGAAVVRDDDAPVFHRLFLV